MDVDKVEAGGCWAAEDRARVLAEVAGELWRYVGRHARDVPAAEGLVADLTGLPAPALETLRRAHLLLCDEVARFVDDALPELLARRRATTERRVEVGRGPVRGPIQWGATAAARGRAGGDRALHASLYAHKHRDTPEMHLLAHLLQGLDRSVKAVRGDIGEPAMAGWGARIDRISGAIVAARRHPALSDAMGDEPRPPSLLGAPASSRYVAGERPDDGGRGGDDRGRLDAGAPSGYKRRLEAGAPSGRGVQLAGYPGGYPSGPRAIDPATVTACARSTRAAVRALADAYACYRDLVGAPTVAALLGALERRALVPLGDDALYELWALLGAVAVLDEAGWRLRAAGLVGQDAIPFVYEAPDGRTTAHLFAGRTPPDWRARSRYRALFERHGLAGAVRRPDLIVELRQGEGERRRHLLIEVKRTRDVGYIADSIYKVLGYLADFSAVFREQPGAHGLLLLWDTPTGTDPTVNSSNGEPAGRGVVAPDPLALATHRTYRRELRGLLDELYANING